MNIAPKQLTEASRDYERIGHAIRYLEDHFQDQPGLEELSAELGLSPAHLQRVFSRWAGVSPKGFVQMLTHAHARARLADNASVLDAAYDAGLSGPSRLHDLFIKVEAMTPGEVKAMGAGLVLRFGWHPTPFGDGLYVMSPRGLAGLAFADPDDPKGHAIALEDMQARWPAATWTEDPSASVALAERLFTADPGLVPVALFGTPFQLQVWQALLRIPEAAAVTYGDIAAHIGRPKAVRAVGTAIGMNPVSWAIPCHRVLRQSGALGGYHWGETRKRAIMVWEGARAAIAAD